MDLDTENRLAALLMEEARRLRREADKDGVHIYLQKPNVRGRPNSRFLTATVLGVEQANRAAEISELWRAREKEHELDAKQRYESKDKSTGMYVRNGYLNEDSRPWLEENSAVTSLSKCHKINSLCGGSLSRHDDNDLRDSSIYCSSSKRYSIGSHSRGDVGLQDDEIDEFLHSRVKRGRGSVGCRMDEPGPYLPSTSANHEQIASPAEKVGEERKHRILGPEKPHFLESNRSHEGVGYAKLQATDECKSKKDHYKEKKKKSKREKSENKRRNEKTEHQKKHQSGGDSRKSKAKYL